MRAARKRPLALVLAALLLSGCGATTHTVLPPAPPGAGRVAATFGLQWSPGKMSFPSVQTGVYVGVGARGVVGGTITDFVLPSSASGAIYAPSGEGWVSARAHVQNLLGEQIGPTYEIEGAYAPASGEATIRAGLGVLAESPVVRAIRRGVENARPAPPPRLVLTLGADAVPGRGLASAEAHLGLGRALARNEIARQRLDMRDVEAQLGDLDSTSVRSVARNEESLFNILTVTLRDGRTLSLNTRDPFPDCFSCALALRRAGAYPPSPGARGVWLSLSREGTFPLMFPVALDPEAILATWRERGVIDLSLPPDAADRAASGAPLWRDVSLLIGVSGGDEAFD